MSVQETEPAAVVVAQQFNPTVVSQKWLEEIELLRPGEIKGDFAFTSAFTQFATDQFRFLLIPDRVSIGLLVPPDQQQALLLERLAKLVQYVPHTPYTGLGLNFTFQVDPDDGDTARYTRGLFFDPGRPLCKAFDAPDARFGGYFSRSALGGRVKLNVKPAMAKLEKGAERHFVVLEVNLHYDIEIEKGAADRIVKYLENWDAARSLAEELVETITARDAK